MMKKRIICFALIALCLALLVCLASCGGKTSGSDDMPHTHAWGEWVEAKAPTCTAAGEQARECSCGEEEIEPIPALGHTEQTVKGSAPTCTEDGVSDGVVCTVCRESVTSPVAIPATGHTYLSERCRDCEVTLTAAVGLEFTENGDGSYTVSGIGSCSSSEILIPREYNGMPVTGIAEGAFSGCDFIVVVVIPETVTTISNGAFRGCSSLESAALSDSVTAVGESAFEGCVKLVIVVLPEGVESIGDSAFSGCVSLGNISVPATLLKIGAGAFDGCSSLVISTTLSAIPDGWLVGNIEVTLGHTHEYGEWQQVKAPTCTDKGIKVQYCECGSKNTAEIDCLPHTEEVVKGFDSTCTERGLTDGRACSVCGTTTARQEIIGLKPHTEQTVKGFDSTCTETGLTDGKVCSVCGTTTVEQTIIKLKPHTEVVHEGYAATCTGTGLTDGRRCSVCGTNTVEREVIPMLPHSEEVLKGYDATCTYTGLTDGRQCTECGAVTLKMETIPIKPHTEELVKGYPATCTEDGSTDGIMCSVCYCYILTPTVIPASHTKEEVKGYDSTCEEQGLTDGVKCSVCGDILVAQAPIPTLAHTYDNGYCTACGARKTSEGLSILENADGLSYYVAGIGSCNDSVIVVPATYNGLPVTGIGERAFAQNTKITGLVLTGNVREIGREAFSYCSALTYAELNDGLIMIGDCAFSYCTSLASVNVPNGTTTIGFNAFEETVLTDIHIPLSVVSVSYGIFKGSNPKGTVYCGAASRPAGWQSDWYSGSNIVWNCAELIVDNGIKYALSGVGTLSVVGYVGEGGSPVIPEEVNGYPVVSVYKEAFRDNTSITAVELPTSITEIGNYAFYGCSQLAKINLTDSITVIGEYAFCGCSLEEIKIPGTVGTVSNYAFSSCKAATSLFIGEGTTVIGERAFSGCTSLTSVYLPDTMRSIGQYAFNGCTALTDIFIPESVTSMGQYVFRSCTDLSIRCAAASKPSAWNGKWNYLTSSTKISSLTWGCTRED